MVTEVSDELKHYCDQLPKYLRDNLPYLAPAGSTAPWLGCQSRSGFSSLQQGDLALFCYEVDNSEVIGGLVGRVKRALSTNGNGQLVDVERIIDNLDDPDYGFPSVEERPTLRLHLCSIVSCKSDADCDDHCDLYRKFICLEEVTSLEWVWKGLTSFEDGLLQQPQLNANQIVSPVRFTKRVKQPIVRPPPVNDPQKAEASTTVPAAEESDAAVKRAALELFTQFLSSQNFGAAAKPTEPKDPVSVNLEAAFSDAAPEGNNRVPLKRNIPAHLKAHRNNKDHAERDTQQVESDTAAPVGNQATVCHRHQQDQQQQISRFGFAQTGLGSYSQPIASCETAPEIKWLGRICHLPGALFGASGSIPLLSWVAPDTLDIANTSRLRAFTREFPGTLSGRFLNDQCESFMGTSPTSYEVLRSFRLGSTLSRTYCEGQQNHKGTTRDVHEFGLLCKVYDLLLSETDADKNRACDLLTQRLKSLLRIFNELQLQPKGGNDSERSDLWKLCIDSELSGVSATSACFRTAGELGGARAAKSNN